MKMFNYEEFNDMVIVRAHGSLTANTLPGLEHTLHSLINRTPAIMALDCTLVCYIDAAVIAFLLRFNNSLKAHDIKFILCNLSRDMRRKLEILTVSQSFKILTDNRYGALEVISHAFQGY